MGLSSQMVTADYGSHPNTENIRFPYKSNPGFQMVWKLNGRFFSYKMVEFGPEIVSSIQDSINFWTGNRMVKAIS